MGGLLSTVPRRRREYHESYRQGARELAIMPAGRRGPADDHTFARYCSQVENLLTGSNNVVEDYEEVRKKFDTKAPMNHAIMKMRRSLQQLRDEYEQFFRQSSWAIDPGVGERKQFGAEAYFKIQSIKDELSTLGPESDDDTFRLIQDAVREQVRLAIRIYNNFEANRMKRIRPGQEMPEVLEPHISVLEDTSL